MKKILLGISMMLMLTGNQVYAYTYLINPDPTDFTIIDRHQAGDIWNDTYKGWSGGNFTGYYLGTITEDPTKPNNNDSPEDLTALINYYLGTSSTYNFSKVDSPTAAGVTSGGLTVQCGTDCLAGTWSTQGENPAVNVAFYSVKAAQEYALYFVDPSTNSGKWSTSHLLTPENDNGGGGNIPKISHLQAATESSNPVPEPATMLLFGAGLIGLAGVARRKVQ